MIVSGKLYSMVAEMEKLLLLHDKTLSHVKYFVLGKFVMCHQSQKQNGNAIEKLELYRVY